MSSYTNEDKAKMERFLCEWHIRIREVGSKHILYDGSQKYELFESGTVAWFDTLTGSWRRMKLGKRAAQRIVAAHINDTDWYNALMWDFRHRAVSVVASGWTAQDAYLELRPFVQEVIDSGKPNPYIA